MAKYEVVNGVGIIPEGVTKIDNKAFEDCTSLTSVVIPSSVTEIGEYAFYKCTSLTSIEIPSNVTEIGRSAFFGCTFLTSIEIPSSVTKIGWNAFGRCTSLTSIVVEEGNSVYDSREGCNAIIETATNKLIQGCNSTIIPSSVTKIGGVAFSGCTSLTSIVIPESVIEIDSGAFGGCTSLTSIVVEEGNSVYDSREGCNAIIETSTNKLTHGCNSTIIPSSITKIGDDAFLSCTFPSIEIPSSVKAIGNYAFCGCDSLTSVVIPSSVTKIGDGAFQCCTSLTSIEIPEGVTEIGVLAFSDCTSLTSVVIPASVTYIEWDAFDECTSIKVINVPANKKDYYVDNLPEEFHSLIVGMAPKKPKGRDVSYGIWRIVRTEDNRTEVYKNNERCPKSAPALREICEELGIEVNPKATTEDLRNKVQKAVLELAQYPIFDLKFKKVDWELNEENIEERREEIDFYGAIYVRGISENGDFDTRVIAGCDIADGLYDAMDVVEEFIDDDWDEVEVYYTTDCDMYGLDDYDSEDQDEALGFVLSSYLGDYSDNYSYDINIPAICRFVCEDFSIVWITSDCGYYDYDFDYDVDALIAYKKR